MSSGDDIEAGRITTAESTTHLVGATPSEQDVNFNGTVILQVGPQLGDLHPTDTLNGILGIGSNPPTPAGIPGGVGVIGNGGTNGGTGVQGDGGGGGTGVVANGGNGGQVGFGIDPAGTGVLARGGKVDHAFAFSTNRAPHGPGVVASAGDSAVPISAESGNVGVFGQGGDQVDETRTFDSTRPPIVVGPSFPGAGVVGRGGIVKGNNGVPGGPVLATGAKSAGVVGIAGGLSMPPASFYLGAGVFGMTDTGAGVSGVSTSGIGVVGVSTSGVGVSGVNLSGDSTASAPGVEGFANANRGGVFTSGTSAQLRLVPLPLNDNPQIAGLPGDLLATIDGEQNAHLWFCRVGGPPGIATWVQLA